MDFLLNPALPNVNPDWPGNPREGRRFREYDERVDAGIGKVLRYMVTPNPQAAEKRLDNFRPPVERGDLQTPGDWVCWLGHATFLIQLGGVRILTDPVFWKIGLIPRLVAMPYDLAELGPLDYVLLSHDHRDHCDETSLRALAERHDFRLLTTLEMTSLVAPWLARGQVVTEAAWYQRYDTTDVEITLMPTQHWCRRYLHDTNRRLWGAFVIRGAGRTIFFGADSAYSPHFAEVAAYFPDVDLAMIGIGAYQPAWMMQTAHTNPEQAWRGFEDTGARRLIPMHYGTYDLSREPPGEPVTRITNAAAHAGRANDLTVAPVGKLIAIAN